MWLALHRRQLRLLGLLEHHLDAHELGGHLLAQLADEAVEQLEGLRLVLVQRVALGHSRASPMTWRRWSSVTRCSRQRWSSICSSTCFST